MYNNTIDSCCGVVGRERMGTALSHREILIDLILLLLLNWLFSLLPCYKRPMHLKSCQTGH